MGTVTVTNCATGETTSRSTTPEEDAAAASRAAAEQAAQATQATETANKSNIETNLEADMVAMQTIIDTANSSIVVTTLPQAQQAARDALQRDKDISRMLKRLGRTALKDYTGTS